MEGTVNIESSEQVDKLRRQMGAGNDEDCCVCYTPTPFWHEAKDVPLCVGCASHVPSHEIPSKKAWLTKLGFNLPDDWKPSDGE